MLSLNSFRLRIALLASALAGVALVGLGAVSGWQIYRAKLSRLDAELINQLMRANHPPDSLHRQGYTHRLPQMLGANSDDAVAVLLWDAQGQERYATPALAKNPKLRKQLQLALQSIPITPEPRLEPPLLPPPDLPPDAPRPPRRFPSPPQFATVMTDLGAWRLGFMRLPNTEVAIAVNLETLDQEMATIQNIFLISIPGILALIAGGAWILAGRALTPVQQLTTAIQQVSAQGLDQRLPLNRVDVEFVELIKVFNAMLERLERSFQQASRFSADAAHELKTPLTILQGELERTLQEMPPGSEAQQRVSHLFDDVGRLNSIIQKLLLLSLADAGQMRLHIVNLDLTALLQEMIEDLELLAPQLTVEAQIQPHLIVPGDSDLLKQALQNLLSNAIKYNLPQGKIQVATQTQGSTLSVQIRNTSAGISPEARDRIFVRFYRGDPARSKIIDGVGLGLSLAREIAWVHGGDLRLADVAAAELTTFILTLPLPPSDG